MDDLGLVSIDEPFINLRNVGMVLAEDHRKMSKSIGNVINPDEVVKKYGADSIRIYEMFMAPFNQEVAWSTAALQGANRFIKRVWQIFSSSDYLTNEKKEEDFGLVTELQSLIDRVESDITNVKFNTPIAAMMAFINLWQEPNSGLNKHNKLTIENGKKFLKLLAPFAPFLAEEIWRGIFSENSSIHLSIWPAIERTNSAKEFQIIPIQVDGKVRDVIEVARADTSKEFVVDLALKSMKVNKWLSQKKYTVVYKEGKIINFVNR